MRRIAIFASGNGSNFEAIAQTFENSDVTIALLVCDKPQAFVIERAKKRNIPVFVLSPDSCTSKAEYETKIAQALDDKRVEFIVLAGYMRLIGPTLLERYLGKIINIHPSLLPAFPGKDAIGQAYRYGVCVTGVTVHFVDAGMDTGPIIAQEAITIERNDSLETLTEKIQRVEHQLYPKAIRQCLDGEVIFKEGRVKWQQQSNAH